MLKYGAATNPIITGPTGAAGAASSIANVAENATTGPTFSWNVPGTLALSGTDASRWTVTTLTTTSARLDPNPAKDFENPLDVGANNAHDVIVTVTATTGGLTATQSCAITITNVIEPPGAPTIGTATAGNTTITGAFTAPAAGTAPPVIDYRLTASPSGLFVDGVASPLTITGAVNGVAQTVTVKARNSDGFGADSAASNSVTPTAPGPTINTQPAAQTVAEGATTAFTVAATGTGTLTYQWQRAAPGSGTFSNVTGATGATHTTAATVCATDHGASYRCNVTDSAGTTTSSAAALTVNAVTSTSRPGADVTATGWTASTGSDLFAMIDEVTASDVDFITSPTLTGSTAPATFTLAFPLAAGDWLLGVRARVLTGAATLRLYLLNAAGTVVGTSASQALTNTFAAYTLPVTCSATAVRARVEILTA